MTWAGAWCPWIGRGHAPSMVTQVPLSVHPHFAAADVLAGGDGADAGRGGHPPTCACRRAGRH